LGYLQTSARMSPVAVPSCACAGSDIRVTTQIGLVELLLCTAEVRHDRSFECEVQDGLLSDGMEYDLTVQLNDGVHAPVVTTVTVTIDGQAPEVAILSPDDGAVLPTSSVTLAGTVTDDLGTPRVFVTLERVDDSTLLLDGAEAVVMLGGTWQLDEGGLADGVRYAVKVLARDEAGNESTEGPREFTAAGSGSTGGNTGSTSGANNDNSTTTGGTSGGTMGDGPGGTSGGDAGIGTGATGDRPMVRAGNSIFGCQASAATSPGAWLLALLLLALRARSGSGARGRRSQ